MQNLSDELMEMVFGDFHRIYFLVEKNNILSFLEEIIHRIKYLLSKILTSNPENRTFVRILFFLILKNLVHLPRKYK